MEAITREAVDTSSERDCSAFAWRGESRFAVVAVVFGVLVFSGLIVRRIGPSAIVAHQRCT